MRLLAYYIPHTFINSIKKLFRTWVAILIVICLGFGLIFGIIGGIAGSMLDDDQPDTEYTEEENPQEPPVENTETAAQILEMAIGGIVLAMLLFAFYNGDKSGTNIFTMADVNFLFPAPIKPQSVLSFRIFLQMGLTFVGSIYLLFQIPNLALNLGLGAAPIIALFTAWIFALILSKLVSVCTYTVTATHPKLKKWVTPVTIAILAVLCGAYLAVLYAAKSNAYDTAVKLFASEASRMIPVWGWFKGLVLYAMEGKYLYAVLCGTGILLVCLLLIFVIRAIKADFYEDALANALLMKERTDAAAQGRQLAGKHSEKSRRNAVIGQGQGANVFFYKTMHIRKRTAKLGIFTNASLFYLVLGCAGAALSRFAFQTSSITVVCAVILTVVFFSNLGNPIAEETKTTFLYLIPENPYKKLFYSLLGSTLNTLLNILPGFLIAAVWAGANPLTSALWFLLFLCFDMFISSTGLLIELLLPSSLNVSIKASLQIMLKMMTAVPTIIILIIGGTMGFMLPALVICSLVNLAVGAAFFAVSPQLLHAGLK